MLDSEAADQSEAWGELKERPFSRADKARRGAVATLAVLGVFVLLLGPAPAAARPIRPPGACAACAPFSLSHSHPIVAGSGAAE
jgi:phosphopantetheinyl transferase